MSRQQQTARQVINLFGNLRSTETDADAKELQTVVSELASPHFATRKDRTMPLTGKAAVVTGSTSGIGLGIARSLAGAGADIMLNGFGEPSVIGELRSRIAKEFGVRVSFSEANVASVKDAADMMELATKELGRVDILVNNAGIQHTGPIEIISDRAMGLHYCGESILELLCHSRCAPGNARKELGSHYQYRLYARFSSI